MSFKILKYANVSGSTIYDQQVGYILENVFMRRVSGTGTVNITQGGQFAYNKTIQEQTYLNGFTGEDEQVGLYITGSAVCDVMLQYTKIDTETIENISSATSEIVLAGGLTIVQLVKIEHLSGVGDVTLNIDGQYICYQQSEEGSFRGTANTKDDRIEVEITGNLIVNISILSNNFTT